MQVSSSGEPVARGEQNEGTWAGIGGHRKILNGAVLGVALQLVALYTSLDALGFVVGIIGFSVGMYGRNRLVKPLHTARTKGDSGSQRLRSWDRRVYANLDIAAWGGAMVLVELVMFILFLLFGLRFPVTPGVH